MYENIAVARINKAVNGIELSFPSGKPAYEVLKALKEHGFRWHNKKQVWYARNTAANVEAVEKYVDLAASDPSFGVTPNGTVDIEEMRNLRAGSDGRAVAETQQHRDEIVVADSNTITASCLADIYASVGRGDICRDSTVEGSLWSPISGRGYYSDINACVWVNREGAHVVELDNAMKRGKVCKHYSIYAMGQDMHLYLANECGVRTPKDLFDLVRSGKELPGDGRLSVREEKGVEVFSPFVVVKPLEKLPEKWKKADLVKAIMAGQVFSGVLDQRLTDDYAYDAAVNFGEGRKIDLAGQAYDLVEGCRDCYIRTNGVDEKGVASIHFSYAGDMKTFLFDVNCDLAEGVRRRESAAQALEAHNLEIRGAVKQISAEEIDPRKVYVMDRVVEDSNSGKLSVASELVQGFVLVDRLDIEDITGLKEAAFVPDRLYEVANFFNRRDYAGDDARVIDTGNWGQLCSGKAVEELTQEGVSLYLSMKSYEQPISFEAAKENCMQFISGDSRFLFGDQVDYTRSLEKLVAEEERVAPQKVTKKEPKPLADVIGFADAKRELEKNQRAGRSLENHWERADR